MYEHGKGTHAIMKKQKILHRAFDLGHELALDRIDALGDQMRQKNW